MTVVKIVGSTLDEVWGDSKVVKKKSAKRAKSLETDACDKIRGSAKFDDIMDIYHPNNYDWADKARYSRTYHPLQDTDGQDRDELQKYVDVSSEQSKDSENKRNNTISKEHFVDVRNIEDNHEKLYLDMSLYVFSGIALIFILEQFISIGMALKY